jgi:hypothetical protein
MGTPVRFQVPILSTGAETSAVVLLELVAAPTETAARIQAFTLAGTPIAEARTWTIQGAELVLELEPQSQIAYASETWYRAIISQVIGSADVSGVHLFQVPVSALTQELAVLQVGDLIPTADLPAQIVADTEAAAAAALQSAQDAAQSASEAATVVSGFLTGATRIEVVDVQQDPEEAGVIYLITG